VTLEEMEANLRTVTDQVGRLMDQVQQKGFVPAFRCGHSQLLFPADYLKMWGHIYGIGLGPQPVSEVLDTDYDTAPPDITPEVKRIEQIMHPLRASSAQMDFVMVAPNVYADSLAVLEREDRDIELRAGIIRKRQLVNPRGRLRVMQAKWEGR